MVVICGETYLTRPDLCCETGWMLPTLSKFLVLWHVATQIQSQRAVPARLWCVIELFVFLEMGGSLENLEAQLQTRRRCRMLQTLVESLESPYAACADLVNAWRCLTRLTQLTQRVAKEVIILPDPENRIADQILDFDPSNLQCSQAETAVPQLTQVCIFAFAISRELFWSLSTSSPQFSWCGDIGYFE